MVRRGRSDVRWVEKVAAEDPNVARILDAGLRAHLSTVNILQIVAQHRERPSLIKYVTERLAEIRGKL